MLIDHSSILLQGIVGSTAYGLQTASSDTDRLGMYAADTLDFHGLHRPKESHVQTKPDVTLHEAAKWCDLALRCNPTVMELVWLPDDLYEVRTVLGMELIAIRQSFLSAPRVRNAYLGYATKQFEKLESRADGTFGPDLAKRTAKHARHMYRLLIQGLELWQTGNLDISLSEHDVQVAMSFGAAVSLGDIDWARTVLADYEDAFNRAPTVLPDKPDEGPVQEWLHQVRREFYTTT